MKQEAVENGGGSGEGSYRRGEDEAGEPGPRGDGEEGAEPQEGDWDHAQAAEGSGRPVRSTRGKPPRQHSPSDEDYRGRGASTPGRSQKGVMASPSSSKLKGGKVGHTSTHPHAARHILVSFAAPQDYSYLLVLAAAGQAPVTGRVLHPSLND